MKMELFRHNNGWERETFGSNTTVPWQLNMIGKEMFATHWAARPV